MDCAACAVTNRDQKDGGRMKDEETLKKLTPVLFYTDTPSGRMYFLSSYHHITNTKHHETTRRPSTKLDLTIKMCICMTPGVQ
jgi:hypothetical protein